MQVGEKVLVVVVVVVAVGDILVHGVRMETTDYMQR